MSSHDDTPTNDGHNPIGFCFEVSLLAGLARHQQIGFQRELEDYCTGRELQYSFTQWMGTVWKEDTDLTLADQCDLLAWLAEQPGVCGAVVSALKPVSGIEDVEGPQLRMNVFAVACTASCLLYRLGLLQPHELAKTFGGFVQPLYQA